MRKGFTIIELIIVIMIIGVLGTIGYKNYVAVTASSKAEQLLSQLEQIKSGMAQYYNNLGTYPTDLSYLIKRPDPATTPTGFDAFSIATVQPEDTTILPYWGGPYVDGMVEDPDAKGCLKSTVGGSICLGTEAIISTFDPADPATFTIPFVNTGLGMGAPMPAGANPTMQVAAGSYTSGGGGSNSHFNVLSINRITKDIAGSIYESANHQAPTNTGNLAKVIFGNDPDTIGIPPATQFAATNRIIYRYSKPY